MGERESRVVLSLEKKITLFEYREKIRRSHFQRSLGFLPKNGTKTSQPSLIFLRKNKQTNKLDLLKSFSSHLLSF